MEDLQGKLGEADIKLAKVTSIVSSYNKELADLKETMKICKKVFYNMGFKDTKNLASAVIFQAQRFKFWKVWMAAVNAISLPKSSTFRDPNQIPLPNDLPIQASTQEQHNDDGDEEGEDSPSMVELAQQIDSHLVVIDVDNPTTNVVPEEQGTLQPSNSLTLASTPHFLSRQSATAASTHHPPHATLSSRSDCGCATKMASAAGSPPSSPLQDNVDAERRLREAEDHLYEAIEELQICLIIGFSSQESRLKVSLF
nr:hypothetical protein CFP56_04756 [Quercus suber]